MVASGVVHVYDSVYRTANKETKDVICNLFGAQLSVRSVSIPRQVGGQDCGLYAIAIATALTFGQTTAALKFRQDHCACIWLNALMLRTSYHPSKVSNE